MTALTKRVVFTCRACGGLVYQGQHVTPSDHAPVVVETDPRFGETVRLAERVAILAALPVGVDYAYYDVTYYEGLYRVRRRPYPSEWDRVGRWPSDVPALLARVKQETDHVSLE